jgi:hypothetical protein
MQHADKLNDIKDRLDELENDLNNKRSVVYYFLGEYPFANKISLFAWDEFYYVDVLAERLERIDYFRKYFDDIKNAEAGRQATEINRIEILYSNEPEFYLIHDATISQFSGLLKEKFNRENKYHTRFNCIGRFAKHEGAKFKENYFKFYSWHPILEQWVEFLNSVADGTSTGEAVSAPNLQIDAVSAPRLTARQVALFYCYLIDSDTMPHFQNGFGKYKDLIGLKNTEYGFTNSVNTVYDEFRAIYGDKRQRTGDSETKKAGNKLQIKNLQAVMAELHKNSHDKAFALAQIELKEAEKP